MVATTELIYYIYKTPLDLCVMAGSVQASVLAFAFSVAGVPLEYPAYFFVFRSLQSATVRTVHVNITSKTKNALFTYALQLGPRSLAV